MERPRKDVFFRVFIAFLKHGAIRTAEDAYFMGRGPPPQ